MSCPRHTRAYVHQTSRETSFVTSSETELIKRRHTHETHAPRTAPTTSDVVAGSRAAVVSGVSPFTRCVVPATPRSAEPGALLVLL